MTLLYLSLSGGTVSLASEKMLKTWNENEKKAAAFAQVGCSPWQPQYIHRMEDGQCYRGSVSQLFPSVGRWSRLSGWRDCLSTLWDCGVEEKSIRSESRRRYGTAVSISVFCRDCNILKCVITCVDVSLFVSSCREEKAIELYKQLKAKCKS